MSLELELIPSHIDNARENEISQFKDQPNFDALLNIFMDEIQELEQVFIDLLLERYLGTAEGVQLDIIGEHVGKVREGEDDTSYRQKLALQIAINTSDGTESAIAGILKVATNADNVQIFQDYSPSATFTVWTDGDVYDVDTLLTLDKVTGSSIRVREVRVSENAVPFGFDGDPQSEGLGSAHATGGGAFSDSILL